MKEYKISIQKKELGREDLTDPCEVTFRTVLNQDESPEGLTRTWVPSDTPLAICLSFFHFSLYILINCIFKAKK